MFIRLEADAPLHAQVYTSLRDGVLTGALTANQRLPSTRALAADLGVSRTVTLQAYERLAAEGYVESRTGSGTFVRADLAGRLTLPTPSAPRPPLAEARLSAWGRRLEPAPAEARRDAGGAHAPPEADFAYGVPDLRSFPEAIWRRCLSRAYRTVDPRYPGAGGHPRLRAAIAAYLRRSRGLSVDEAQVVVTSGSQQALDLVARLFVDPGDGVVLEEPQYHGVRRVCTAAGARVFPVPVDAEGLDPAALPRGKGVRLVCVTPSHQFPTGGVLPLARRLALLEWAGREEAVVLEDDYDGEYRYDVPPVETVFALDRNGLVLHAGTFSKVMFPGLRMAYLVVPEHLVGPAVAAKWVTDRHAPGLVQAAVAAFIEEGHFERHIRRTRVLYGSRRAALLEALSAALGSRVHVMGADAGMHVLVRFPDVEVDAVPGLIAGAAARGVRLYSSEHCYLGQATDAELVFGYATATPEEIGRGVDVLSELLARPRSSPR